jgi:hypothetical protein
MDIIELLLPYGFDTLEYSWVKATIGICMLADYSIAKKCQQRGKNEVTQDNGWASLFLVTKISSGCRGLFRPHGDYVKGCYVLTT